MSAENGEGLQILNYDVGQKYEPHYDYFADKVNTDPSRGGQRLATMLMYLYVSSNHPSSIVLRAPLPLLAQEDP
eukprot:1191382-Prorocentrum_minimum.AAC.1